MSNLRELSWADRFAVIDALDPTDEQITAALDIDPEELAAARELREAGHVPTPDEELNVSDYADAFEGVATALVEPTDVTEEDTTPLVTATAPTATPKKRGRKGDKIATAFDLVTTTATDANAFAVNNNVSLNVLRQAKRFDPFMSRGKVRVKKIDGTLSIYRDEPETV